MAKNSNSRSQVKTKLYAVLRLNESVEVNDMLRGKTLNVKVTNDKVAGYIPVFKTIESAQENSSNGKYQIVAINPA